MYMIFQLLVLIFFNGRIIQKMNSIEICSNKKKARGKIEKMEKSDNRKGL